MIKHQPRASDQLFVETSMGIVTRYGDWFHITSGQIRKYVPGLLEKVSLEELIGAAQAWVKSADSLSLVFLLGMLFLVNPWLAASLTIIFHIFWYFYKSAMVVIGLNKVFKFINSDGFLLLSSLVVLSVLGMQGYYTEVGIGLFFFFLLKLGLLKRIWNKLADVLSFSLTLNDRVLKMIIIKYGIYEDVAPPEIREMEEKMKELAFSHKK